MLTGKAKGVAEFQHPLQDSSSSGLAFYREAQPLEGSPNSQQYHQMQPSLDSVGTCHTNHKAIPSFFGKKNQYLILAYFYLVTKPEELRASGKAQCCPVHF